MSGVNVKYKNSTIASLEDSGSSTLNTSGKYCEGDIVVVYDAPEVGSQVSGTIEITSNGLHDVSTYEKANVQVANSTLTQPSNLKCIHRFTMTLSNLSGNGFGFTVKKNSANDATNWYGIMMVKRGVAPMTLPNNITICGGMGHSMTGYGRAWVNIQTISSSGSIANVNMGSSGGNNSCTLKYLATSTDYPQWEGVYDGYIFEYDSTYTGIPSFVKASSNIIEVHADYTGSTSIIYEI